FPRFLGFILIRVNRRHRAGSREPCQFGNELDCLLDSGDVFLTAESPPAAPRESWVSKAPDRLRRDTMGWPERRYQGAPRLEGLVLFLPRGCMMAPPHGTHVVTQLLDQLMKWITRHAAPQPVTARPGRQQYERGTTA